MEYLAQRVIVRPNGWHIEEVRVPDVPVQIVYSKIREVEGIKQIHAELEQMSFLIRHHETLAQGQVPILPTGVREGVT